MSVKVEGIEEAMRVLEELPDKTKMKAIIPSLNTAGRVVIQAARRKLPRKNEVRRYEISKGKNKGKVIRKVATGNLRASIGRIKLSSFKRRKRLQPIVLVGPRAYGKYRGFHGHLVEFGHQNASPHPYMRPAYEETKGQARKIVSDAIVKYVNKVNGR